MCYRFPGENAMTSLMMTMVVMSLDSFSVTHEIVHLDISVGTVDVVVYYLVLYCFLVQCRCNLCAVVVHRWCNHRFVEHDGLCYSFCNLLDDTNFLVLYVIADSLCLFLILLCVVATDVFS